MSTDNASHGHSHGTVDPSITSSERGLWATKWSFVALAITAGFQLVVVIMSNSVALLADMIHNLGDAATAIPLGIAFVIGRRAATRRFTYGFGRVEDLAGLAVVLTILVSAVVAFYQAVGRLMNPQPITHLAAVMAASIVGFAGNELVALFRIRVGREIGSAALIADGYHARTDGWTSLAVLVGALGVYFGFPKADPLIGLLIAAAILVIVWRSGKSIISRMIDGVDAGVVERLEASASGVAGVVSVESTRVRWIGHRMRAELTVTVEPTLTVAESHQIAGAVEEAARGSVEFLSDASVHVDPATASAAPHDHDETGHGISHQHHQS